MRKVYAKIVLDNMFFDISKMFNNQTEPRIILRHLRKKVRELEDRDGKDYYKVVWFDERAYRKVDYKREYFNNEEEKLIIRNDMIIEE